MSMSRRKANIFRCARKNRKTEALSDLGIEMTPHTRLGSKLRAAGVRSRKQRCPRCKKIRMKWLEANWCWDDKPRKRWQHRKEGLVCHICIVRENKE